LDEGETESRAQPLVGGQLVEILREPRFVDAIQGPNKPELPGPKLNGSTPSRADDAVDHAGPGFMERMLKLKNPKTRGQVKRAVERRLRSGDAALLRLGSGSGQDFPDEELN